MAVITIEQMLTSCNVFKLYWLFRLNIPLASP
jgi:hypothetical protein